jgi:serine protease Do
LQHDAYIPLTSCGGPLVDLDGRVIGINIATFSSVESYAIPADVIRPLLFDLASGKLAPLRKSEERR